MTNLTAVRVPRNDVVGLSPKTLRRIHIILLYNNDYYYHYRWNVFLNPENSRVWDRADDRPTR